MRTSSGPRGPVAHLPAAVAQLVAQAVGLGVVLRRARRLAGLEQLLLLGAGLAAVLGEVLQAQHVEHLDEVGAPDRLVAAPVGLLDPVEHRRQRGGRVEVLGERLEERVAVGAHVGGRLAVDEAARGVAHARHAGERLHEAHVVEGHRLAVVGADEEHDQRVAARRRRAPRAAP